MNQNMELRYIIQIILNLLTVIIPVLLIMQAVIGVAVSVAATVSPLLANIPFVVRGIVYILDRWSVLIWMFYILASIYVRYCEGKLKINLPRSWKNGNPSTVRSL